MKRTILTACVGAFMLDGCFECLLGPLIEVESAAEVGLVGVGIDARTVPESTPFLGCQLHLDFAGNRIRDLALESQDVVELPLVAVGPEVLIGMGFDELSADANAITGAQDSTLQHRVDSELVRDFRKRFVR